MNWKYISPYYRDLVLNIQHGPNCSTVSLASKRTIKHCWSIQPSWVVSKSYHLFGSDDQLLNLLRGHGVGQLADGVHALLDDQPLKIPLQHLSGGLDSAVQGRNLVDRGRGFNFRFDQVIRLLPGLTLDLHLVLRVKAEELLNRGHRLERRKVFRCALASARPTRFPVGRRLVPVFRCSRNRIGCRNFAAAAERLRSLRDR